MMNLFLVKFLGLGLGIWILIAVAVVLLGVLLGGYNGLAAGRNRVEEAFSTMDVYLKKRWDLIPNLVETVKGYAKHEKETLENVIAARNINYSQLTPEQKIDANAEMSGFLGRLMAVSENYPALQANQNFLGLQTQLQQIEADIANARKYYNAEVRAQNNRVTLFPSSLIAAMFRFKKEKYFEVAAANERENVAVKF